MEDTSQTDFVSSTLERYRNLTVGNLLTLLPSERPHYLYDLIPDYPARPGKGLRAALCIATCKAFGGSVSRVLNTATAIEMFHNAFLIHDDIQDQSEFRRGSPTLHAEHGVGIAVNVGNALNLTSLHQLMENRRILGRNLAWQIFTETEEMLRHTLEGQALELGWIRDNVCDLADKDYFRMCLKKTSWYTCIYPCRVGALVATSSTANLDRFYLFAWYLGAAFQIQDDILNLAGDFSKYGKEIHGDIWEGKRTLILIHLLNNCGSREKARLRRFLAKTRDERSPDEVAWVYGLMVKHRSIATARSSARNLAGAALREFVVAYSEAPESDDKRFILELILYMIRRDR